MTTDDQRLAAYDDLIARLKAMREISRTSLLSGDFDIVAYQSDDGDYLAVFECDQLHVLWRKTLDGDAATTSTVQVTVPFARRDTFDIDDIPEREGEQVIPVRQVHAEEKAYGVAYCDACEERANLVDWYLANMAPSGTDLAGVAAAYESGYKAGLARLIKNARPPSQISD